MSLALTPEDVKLISDLTNKLATYRQKNLSREIYYEGNNRLKNLRIAMPQHYENMSVAVSWPEIVVERKNERINLTGFTTPDNIDISDIFRSNFLDLDSKLAHRDALLYGVAYAVAGFGDVSKGEPAILITMESPNNTIGTANRRSRDLDNLLQVSYNKQGIVQSGVLHTRDKTISFNYDTSGMDYQVVAPTFQLAQAYQIAPGIQQPQVTYKPKDVVIEVHERGFVPAVQFINRPRSSRPEGSSEITRTIIDHTDQAVITYTQAALAREVYATPQRYILNIDSNSMKDQDGRPRNGLKAYFDRMFIIGASKDKNAPVPQIGQFDASSPAPLLELIKSFAEMISAASGIPMAQLGFASTANPASADAIVASSEIAIKSAEDRMDSFGVSWTQLMLLCLRLRDGKLPDGYEEIRPIWRSAAMPTKAADADAATKLVQVGILLADSEVTYNRLGFTESEKQILREEKEARDAKLAGTQPDEPFSTTSDDDDENPNEDKNEKVVPNAAYKATSTNGLAANPSVPYGNSN